MTALLPMVVDTIRDPRGTFGRLLSLRLPRAALFEGLVLVVVLSVLLAEVSNLVLSRIAGQELPQVLASPFVFGALQLGLLLIMVVLIDRIGRGMGGSGDFDGALLLVTWLQFVMVCLQVAQSLAILVLPPLAWAIGVGGIILFMWQLTVLVAVLHGFASLGRVFGMILFVMLGAALALSVVLTAMGVTVPRA
jgi:hypothetical protein